MRGIENPHMSASSKPTRWPRSAMASARLTLADDLPTPPLPLPTAMTLVNGLTKVGSAFSLAFNRAVLITSAR